MEVKRSPVASILAGLFGASAICGIVIGLELVQRGQSPIPLASVGDWYRDTILALAEGALAAVAASLALGLRRPLVPVFAGVAALVIVVGVGGLLVPREPLMPVAMTPAIVASVLALLLLALPIVRHRLPA